MTMKARLSITVSIECEFTTTDPQVAFEGMKNFENAINTFWDKADALEDTKGAKATLYMSKIDLEDTRPGLKLG